MSAIRAYTIRGCVGLGLANVGALVLAIMAAKLLLAGAVRTSVKINAIDRESHTVRILERIDKMEQRLGGSPGTDLSGSRIEARR